MSEPSTHAIPVQEANASSVTDLTIRDDVSRLNDLVAKYEALRQRVYDALVERECPGWWLATAFQNEGPAGIRDIYALSDGIHVSGSCWTSQTGGPHETWQFTIPRDAARDLSLFPGGESNE